MYFGLLAEESVNITPVLLKFAGKFFLIFAVVAIIAVLVAVAIPVFSNQQKRAEVSKGIANVRGAYAEKVADKLAEGIDSSGKITVDLTSSKTQTNCTVKYSS